MVGGKSLLGIALVDQQCLHGAAKELPQLCVAAGIHLPLQAQTDSGHGIIDQLHHMKHVNADVCVGEDLLGNGQEAIMHVAAEIPDTHPLVVRILAEISLDEISIDLRQNVQNIALAAIAVDNVAVITRDAPAGLAGMPCTGGALELVNAECFRKMSRQTKFNGSKNLGHKGRRNAVDVGNGTEGRLVHEVMNELVVQRQGHAKTGVNPIGLHVEGMMAAVAEQPELVEGHQGASVMTYGMADGLVSTGVLDDAVAGMAVGTNPLLRQRIGDDVLVTVLMADDARDGNRVREIAKLVDVFGSDVFRCHWIASLL